MKLKAPQGVGDPCVAGITITARGGIYEVEAEIATLLIECFGFVAIEGEALPKAKAAPAVRRAKPTARKS